MKGWTWKGGGTKEDIEQNLDVLRQRSRALYMTTPIARAALNRMQVNVVGQGLRLRANPDADVLGISSDESRDWVKRTEREFALWAESHDCDWSGLNTFYEIQQIALLAWLQSGDTFALLPMADTPGQPYGLRIHLIEADRVCDPSSIPSGTTVRQGVELDNVGRVVAYHVKNSHPLSHGNGDADAMKWQRIEARGTLTGRRNIIHLMVAERPEQYRGVPYLAPVIEACKQIGRYSEAELMAAVVCSMYTVFIKSENPDTPFGESRYEDRPDQVSSHDREADYNYNLGPGAIVALNPNEDITVANPGRPNQQFDAFVMAISREIGAALNIPSEMLLLQFTSSYSASRAALLEAWKCFRMWRAWMCADFCHLIYIEWLTEAILRQRISAPGFFDDPAIAYAWARAEWHGPAPGQVDPVKEVTAAKTRVEEGFSTRARETAELTGGDYESNIAQLQMEEQLRRQAGLASSNPGIIPPTNEDIDTQTR
jgi:lambda family phage portal protein